ncbi:MAG: restriction endonuclease subunit S [Magnetococcales bacterium]|nr:restriction endonuclease subunit S [Magnetococcales bacterium]
MKDETKALVPRLRFPEFRDVGEWEETSLGSCLSKHPEYGINAPSVPYAENLPTYLRITDISDNGQIRQEQKVSVAKEVTEENYLEEGDIVLARTGASVGKAYKYRTRDGRLVFAGFLIRVRPEEEKLNSELLFQFLFSEQYWRWVAFCSARSGQPGINGNEYASLPLHLPPQLKEQQKIADCLSSLDALIAAHIKKLEALTTHKKGLMQQLFPREGETVPRLRFPEFRDVGEWEEKTLAESCRLQAGKFVRASDIHEKAEADRYPCYGGNGLRGYTLTCTHSGAYPLIGRQGAQCGNVNLVHGKFHATEHAVVVSPYQGVNTTWIFYQLIRMNLNQYATGQAQPGLSVENLDKLIVRIPTNENEQQEIADCLSSLDTLITAHTKKLETLKTHKKGLMQQLFPNPEAVGS